MFNEPSLKALKHLPRLGINAETPLDKIVIHGHFFLGSCDWYVAEFDGQDTFWGFVNLGSPQNAEWGPFPLSELRDLRVNVPVRTKAVIGHLPLEVEWDEHWRARPFSEIGWEA